MRDLGFETGTLAEVALSASSSMPEIAEKSAIGSLARLAQPVIVRTLLPRHAATSVMLIKKLAGRADRKHPTGDSTKTALTAVSCWLRNDEREGKSPTAKLSGNSG